MERDHRLNGLKRRFLLLTLTIVSLAGFTEWLFFRSKGLPAPPIALPTALVPLGLALLLWRKRRSLRFVETATLVGIGVVVLTLMYEVLFGHQIDGLDRLASFSPWISVALIVLFLVLGSRRATWIASGLYAAALGLGLAYLIGARVRGEEPAFLGPLIQLYLANAVLICFLFYYDRVRERYEQTRSLARSMADLAHTDPLLGIPNRRQMSTVIQQEIRCAEDGTHPATLIMFDLDRFKEVNDTFGHETGDHVLQVVAAAVRQTLRSSDRFGRWGGDEFVALVNVTDLSQAHLLAQRLGEAVHSRLSDRFWRVTISLGVAPYHWGDDVESWINRADQALYRAKETGRNRVVVGS